MRAILAATRREKGLRQSDIARRLNITTRQYQRIEAGTIQGKPQMWDALEDLLKKPQRELRWDGRVSAKNRTNC